MKPLDLTDIAIAFNELFQKYIDSEGPWPAAVDITDGACYPWLRFFRDFEWREEVSGKGICKVYVIWHTDTSASVLVLCRCDDTYAEVHVKATVPELDGKKSWRTNSIFTSAQFAEPDD